MIPVIAATFTVAGVGLALTPYVLLSEDALSSRRWDPMDLVIQIAGWSLMLLAAALEHRRRAARRLDTYGEEIRNG